MNIDLLYNRVIGGSASPVLELVRIDQSKMKTDTAVDLRTSNPSSASLTQSLGCCLATTGWNGRILLPYTRIGDISIQSSVGINVFQACIGVMIVEMQFGASLKVTYGVHLPN